MNECCRVRVSQKWFCFQDMTEKAVNVSWRWLLSDRMEVGADVEWRRNAFAVTAQWEGAKKTGGSLMVCSSLLLYINIIKCDNR